MSPNDLLASMLSLPGETPCELVVGRGPYTVGDLKAAATNDGPKLLTTVQAAARYGWSANYWRKVAKSRGVPRDRLWRIPVAVCEEHIVTKSRAPRTRRPWGA